MKADKTDKADKADKADKKVGNATNTGTADTVDTVDVVDVVDVVDAVFVIGTGSRHANEELKYALRNVERNCPFVRNVYIVGVCPDWVDTTVVKHVDWQDRFTHAKDANIVDKLRKGCEQPGIAKKILFCSDDQFQTRVCKYDDFNPMYLRRYDKDDTWYADRKRIWHTRLRNTLERDRKRREQAGLNTNDVFYYQPHIYMPIDRDKFIEFAKWADYEHRDDTIIASAYFNYIDAKGTPNHDHIFITGGQEFPVKETHVAYHDTSFDAAMKWLKATFPKPSKYEKSVTIKKNTTDDSLLQLINKVKESIEITEAYAPVRKNVEIAEALRKADASGWRTVWTDLVGRWATSTSGGTKKDVQVAQDIGVMAESIMLQHKKIIEVIPEALEYIDKHKKRQAPATTIADTPKEKAPAQSTQPTQSTQSTQQPQPQPQPQKKSCSKCEAKRRAAEEAAKKKAEEEKAQAEAVRKVLDERKETVKEPIKEEQEEDTFACLDCARGHLAAAIAYMSTNMGRPTAMETELAKGELNVLAQHLLALKRNAEYNRIIEILDSVYSENSIFNVASLRGLLEKLMS